MSALIVEMWDGSLYDAVRLIQPLRYMKFVIIQTTYNYNSISKGTKAAIIPSPRRVK